MMPLTIHRYGSSNARKVLLVHGLTEAGTTWPDLVGHWGDDWQVLAPTCAVTGSRRASPRTSWPRHRKSCSPMSLGGERPTWGRRRERGLPRRHGRPGRPGGTNAAGKLLEQGRDRGVGRSYVRRGLYLGDDAWQELFDALRLPTLLLVPPDLPIAPRQEAVHNDLVRTVVAPGAGRRVRRDQPAGYLRAVDVFLAEVARA